MLRKVLIVLASGVALSCSQEQGQPMDNPTQIDKYFPLKDFVENQILLLDGSKVKKSISIKGQVENTTLEMDAEAWRRELDIFIQSDINKASLATAYETEKTESLIIHMLKPGEESHLQEIRVAYEDGQVRQVNFHSSRDDFFYSTGSEGELVIDSSSGKIQAYRVIGTQNTWFISPNEMIIEGEVLP